MEATPRAPPLAAQCPLVPSGVMTRDSCLVSWSLCQLQVMGDARMSLPKSSSGPRIQDYAFP